MLWFFIVDVKTKSVEEVKPKHWRKQEESQDMRLAQELMGKAHLNPDYVLELFFRHLFLACKGWIWSYRGRIELILVSLES